VLGREYVATVGLDRDRPVESVSRRAVSIYTNTNGDIFLDNVCKFSTAALHFDFEQFVFRSRTFSRRRRVQTLSTCTNKVNRMAHYSRRAKHE
jgi:hypothetical protein